MYRNLHIGEQEFPVTSDVMDNSVYSSITDEIQSEMARFNTNLALCDTFIRTHIKQYNEYIKNNNQNMKEISADVSDLIKDNELFVEYLTLPWYKKIFTNFIKYKKKHERDNL